VMEYVPGPTLEQVMAAQKKGLQFEEALRLIQEIAEALDCAHAQGIVHRDIKPANILLTEDGRPKIADFGIARIDLPNSTVAGKILGTPAYMSPEQIEGGAVDGRSDIFSLGVVLYRTVTGYEPFQGNSITTVCFQVASREPMRASMLKGDIPPQLDSVLARAMAKDPRDRYQRGMELALDLKELREGREPKSDVKISSTTHSIARIDGAEPKQLPPQGLFNQSWKLQPWMRRPAVRAAFVFAFASLALGLPTYFELRSRRREAAADAAMSTSAAPGEKSTQPDSPPPVVAPSQPASQSAFHAGGAPQVADSALELQLQHQLSAATLSLWIDGKLAFSGQMQSQAKRKLVFFHSGSKEQAIVPLPHGNHKIRVRVVSVPDHFDQSATVNVSFVKNLQRVLRINCDKSTGDMHTTLQ